MHWKIANDAFYKILYEQHGIQAVYEAGFFMDNATTPLIVDDCLLTPVDKIRKNLDKYQINTGAPVYVLFVTGSFNPIHQGHVDMMERAKEYVEAQGHIVVGGYMSPSHDQYVRSKLSSEALSISHRMKLIVKAIANSDWLMADSWEGVGIGYAVNFTSVYMRLENYLHKYIGTHVRLVYVSGGDNASFALAFANKGYCAIVQRDEHDQRWLSYQEHLRLRGKSNVFWVPGSHSASSSKIRQGDYALLPHGISLNDVKPTTCKSVSLRIETQRVVEHFAGGSLSHKWTEFQENVVATFRKYFQGDVYTHNIVSATVEDNDIDLDIWSNHKHTFSITRCFDLGGYEQLGYVARPSAPSLEAQIASIPQGSYYLVDDDQVTGGTLRYIRSILPQNIQVLGHKFHADGQIPFAEDYADVSDFLFGAKNSGLTVLLPNGKTVRVPYMLPYLNPHIRSGLPADSVWAFSLEMWQHNLAFFQDTTCTVAELEAHGQDFALFLGATPETTILKIVQQHIDILSTIVRQLS